MLSIVIIQKNEEIKTKKIRGFDIDTFWKKCGFASSTSFGCIHTFNMKDYKISLFSKTEGKSNNVNKFELPPPVDKDLYYGNIVAVLHKDFDTENIPIGIINYTETQWVKDYETLMGGFEELDDNSDSDETDENEMTSIPEHMKTKEGYFKDNFVIDDNSSISSIDTEYNDVEYVEDELHEDEYTDTDED